MPSEMADSEIIGAMRAYGGSFVQAIAQAASVADQTNLAKLKAAFPEYWKEYADLAALAAKRKQPA